MKKKRILPLVALLTVIGLTACEGGASSVSSTSESSSQTSSVEPSTEDSSEISSSDEVSSEDSSTGEDSSSEDSSTGEDSSSEDSSTGEDSSSEDSSTDDSSSSSSEDSSSVEEIPVEGVSLDQTSAVIEIEETLTLTATITPSNATDQSITWTSSDESVATVENGVVTGVAAGSTTITATAGGLSATCEITVNQAAVSISTIYTMENGDYVRIKGQVISAGGTNAFINDGTAGVYVYNWKSSDNNTGLDENGYFIQDSYVDIYGYISIYSGLYELVNTNDQSTTYVHTYTPESPITPTTKTINDANDISGFTASDVGAVVSVPYATYVSGSLSSTASNTSLRFSVNGTNFVLYTSRYDPNWSSLYESWSSLNLQVGDLVSISAVAYWYNGFQLSYYYEGTTIEKVTAPAPDSLTATAASTSIEVGSTTTVSLSGTPWYADTSSATWSSSNADVATVENGTVTGVSEGSATITATIGSASANVNITVTAATSGGDEDDDTGKATTQSLTITAEGFGGLASSYADYGDDEDVTIDGVGMYGYQLMKNANNAIQMRVNSGNQSCFYNTTALSGTIESITLTFDSAQTSTKDLLYVAFGTEMVSAPSSGTNVTYDGTNYTYTVTPEGDYSYFNVCHSTTSGGVYLASVVVNYTVSEGGSTGGETGGEETGGEETGGEETSGDTGDTDEGGEYDIPDNATAISTVDEFTSFFNGTGESCAKNAYLAADIDLTGTTLGGPAVAGEYSAIFEGCGHTVTYSGGALFNIITGTVRNINVVNTNWATSGYGTLAYSVSGGMVDNVDVEVTISSSINSWGPVAFFSTGTISNCDSTIHMAADAVSSNTLYGAARADEGSTFTNNTYHVDGDGYNTTAFNEVEGVTWRA